jgi:hypothetical protein
MSLMDSGMFTMFGIIFFFSFLIVISIIMTESESIARLFVFS